MHDASLDYLLSQILSPDNVQRTLAERELERRSREFPGFCVALANHCRALLHSGPAQRATMLVALSVLKRGLTASDSPAEVQQVIAVLLAEVGSLACGGSAAAAMRQWAATVNAAVRRLATVLATSEAPFYSEATTNAITAQLLAALDQPADASADKGLVAYSHLWLLRVLFEEPVPSTLHGWCGELLLSCAPALFSLLCGGAATAAATSQRETLGVRCALVTLVAKTLAALYEWQFAQSGRQGFPAELKRHFLSAFPLLQSFASTPCTHWLPHPSASSTGAASGPMQTPATCVAAASLAVLEFVASVLQYGGWYKRCVTAELLQATLQSLAADAECHAAAPCLECEDAGDELAVDGSWESGDVDRDAASVAWAAVVRRRATQCWSFFRDMALLPFIKVGFVDVVGHQCGLQYYRLLLSYAALAASDAEASLQDPNAFLRGEEEREDGLRWTARDIVAQLYADSITALGPLFLHASLEDLNECLFADVTDGATTAFTPPHQRREAALFFMETVLRHRARPLRECGAADFMPLATHVWTRDVAGAGTHPVVAARALHLVTAILHFTFEAGLNGSAVVTFMTGAVADSVRVLSAFTGTAEPPTCTPLVALLLCRLLQHTLPHWPKPLVAQQLSAWQCSLIALLSPQAGLTEEALYSTVEQLADLVRAGRAAHGGNSAAGCVSPPVLDALPHAIMDCWRRHVSDPSFADAALRLLRRIVRDSDNGAPLLLGELQWVNNVLSGYAESMAELCAVPYFLRLLTHVFEHATGEVANAAAALMLDSLCQLLLSTDESAILAASSSCLAALLRRCPAAQSVMVRVVPASVEAALSGADGGGEDAAGCGPSGVQGLAALVADAPRASYPFSTVIVAIVLRTLDDRRDEASLMDMGGALVTIMRQSTSFSEVELVRVIHATVHRLAVVRTDTVSQQLLAPLATLLHLHPVALLRTLVQGGLLAETMRRWLPQVEHFSSLSATFASCTGLLQLLACLSPTHSPSLSASMPAEEVQHIAQQLVTCRWRLPVELAAGNAGPRKTSRKSKKAGGGSSSSATSAPRSALSSLVSGATVETAQPLYAAVLVGVGRGLLPLLSAPAAALRRAGRAAAAGVTSDDDEDETDGGGLFGEDTSDDEGAWSADDGDDSMEEVGGGAEDSAAEAVVPPGPSAEAEASAERQRLLASMGAAMLPWMQAHGGDVTAYFTATEAERLMSFFTASASTSIARESAPST